MKNLNKTQVDYAAYFNNVENGLPQKILRKLRFHDLEILKYVKIEDKILDCGCGTGYCLNYLNKNGFKNLFGFDIDETFFKKIINKPYTLKNHSITEAHLNYPENYFDIIICYDVFHHLLNKEDYEKAIKAIYKILKKDGYFFLADPTNNTFFKIMLEVARFFSPISNACKAAWESYYYIEKKEFDLYFTNKDKIYFNLLQYFNIIKTKNALYRSITIFQKIK